MGMAAILFNSRNHANKLSIPIRRKAPVKSGETCSGGFREVKNCTVLYMYIAQDKGR